ncbi:MAG: CBS domain-containing protein, partial [Candidatus Nitrosotenuis sp.]
MLRISDLVVGNYMTAFPISVLPEVSIPEIISFMARRGIGNIVVSDDGGSPLGILTEREILQLLVLHKSLPNIPVGEVTLSKFEKIT